MTEKKNKAIITYSNVLGEEVEHVIEYNSMFSFMETPNSLIFLLNDAPIKVINKDMFVSLDMVYENNPDDTPRGEHDENVVSFKPH